MSPKFSLNNADLVKIGTGALVAAVGAGAVYGIEGIARLDFGLWGPAITALAGILANIVRKWVAGK